jgi:hypothetical protein
MTKRRSVLSVALGAFLCALPAAVSAQGRGLSLPPSGGNQKASVSQFLGLVEVTIAYSSPDVTGPQGEDRRGKIWGQLVPYGMNNLGFGTATESPWRAGANENTVFSVSHDVLIEGKKLPAGRYGLHMIAQEEGKPWTIIFSNNSTSWGSFFYEPSEDALRVEVTPEKAPYHEWLTYEFTDRQQDKATAALVWEEKRIPFQISVPDNTEVYLTQIRHELRDSPGFTWQNWDAAAQFCLANKTNLEEALTWAETAVSTPFVGQQNATTLQTKAQVQLALGKKEAAAATLELLANDRSSGPVEIHTAARTMQAAGETATAIALFKKNGQRFGDEWPVHVGLARAYSAEGNFKEALVHARKAHEQAPDALNKGNLEKIIEILESGKDFNPTN